MTESADTPPPVVNPIAARLASELGGYSGTPGISQHFPHMMTSEQQALIADTFGLLNGIGFGTISTSQPRIRDNLVRVISGLPNGEPSDKSTGLVNALSAIISGAGSAGLTAENQPLTARTSLRNR